MKKKLKVSAPPMYHAVYYLVKWMTSNDSRIRPFCAFEYFVILAAVNSIFYTELYIRLVFIAY